jgi:hypothetical protein
MAGGTIVLPIFDNAAGAERWMMGLNLEQHYVSPALPPAHAAELMRTAYSDGFTHCTLNPPPDIGLPVQLAPIGYLISQAEQKTEARQGRRGS